MEKGTKLGRTDPMARQRITSPFAWIQRKEGHLRRSNKVMQVQPYHCKSAIVVKCIGVITAGMAA